MFENNVCDNNVCDNNRFENKVLDRSSDPGGTHTVSVVMPALNASSTIGESIASALDQTSPPLEIIVVDDGSVDDTASIARSFGPRVRVLRPGAGSGGPGRARNAAAAVAAGDWLAFLDADDLWLPNKLQLQLSLIADPVFDDDVALIYTDRENFGRLGGLSSRQSDGVTLHEGHVLRPLLIEGNFITLSSAMVRRDVFETFGGFDESSDLIGVEDWELWLRIAAKYRVARCQEPLVRYRCHAGGISKNVPSMFAAQQEVLRRRLVEWKETGTFDAGLARQAWAASAAISGFFARNQGESKLARRLYFKAICHTPTNRDLYKQWFKAAIHRR